MGKVKDFFRNLKLNSKFTLLIMAFTVIPICVMAGVLFYIMEENVVKENLDYMEYTMQRSRDAISTKIDSINMSTQFFLSEETLLEILNKNKSGEEISREEWLAFKDYNVASLERLVNNNPLLYGVRVYAETDAVQEMMPILYRKTRMNRQSWASEMPVSGWRFNYYDNIFSTYSLNQNRKILSLVTPVWDSTNGQIGTIEAAMTMENMFPSLYESIENEWSFFYTEKGESYFGHENLQIPETIMTEILDYVSEVPKEGCTKDYQIDGEHLVVSYMPVNELSGTLVCVKNITGGIHEVHNIRNVFLTVMLGFLCVLAIFINQIVRGLLHQFYDILHSIRQVQKGDLNIVIENCGKDEMGELGTQINKMLERIRRLMEDNLKREMLMKNSEIRALQNQINAHFIYNVLESIKMMAEIDEEYAISDAVTSLGKLLRYSMKWVNGNVLVEQELEYIKNYMALINLRFDYEIYLSLNLPEFILKQEIPKMSLQPIVENAIYHGIEQMAEDTNIYIKGFVSEGDCIIEITDAGKGMTEEEVEKLRLKIAGELDSNGGSGNGIGLKNVQDRIHIAFGEQYGIEIRSRLGCFTKVIVRIPVTCEGTPEERKRAEKRETERK